MNTAAHNLLILSWFALITFALGGFLYCIFSLQDHENNREGSNEHSYVAMFIWCLLGGSLNTLWLELITIVAFGVIYVFA